MLIKFLHIDSVAKTDVHIVTSASRSAQKDNVHIMEPIPPFVLETKLEPYFDSVSGI